jgi:hypothetical protein
MDPKKSKKLRALVYVGLAGGLVGVSTMSTAAHGNASSHTLGTKSINWQADDFKVVDDKTDRGPVKVI